MSEFDSPFGVTWDAVALVVAALLVSVLALLVVAASGRRPPLLLAAGVLVLPALGVWWAWAVESGQGTAALVGAACAGIVLIGAVVVDIRRGASVVVLVVVVGLAAATWTTFTSARDVTDDGDVLLADPFGRNPDRGPTFNLPIARGLAFSTVPSLALIAVATSALVVVRRREAGDPAPLR